MFNLKMLTIMIMAIGLIGAIGCWVTPPADRSPRSSEGSMREAFEDRDRQNQAIAIVEQWIDDYDFSNSVAVEWGQKVIHANPDLGRKYSDVNSIMSLINGKIVEPDNWTFASAAQIADGRYEVLGRNKSKNIDFGLQKADFWMFEGEGSIVVDLDTQKVVDYTMHWDKFTWSRQ